MKPLLTRAESRDFDARAAEDRGVAGLVLMENAGRGAFEAIQRRFPRRLARVICVGGPGQNGGDAWVLARHLACSGFTPEAWLVGDPEKLRGDARPNWASLGHLGVAQQVWCEGNAEFDGALSRASLVVDGVFGTGLDRPLTGALLTLMRALTEAQAPLVALDLPSGVDADTGAVLGAAPRAALTLCFGAGKPGVHQHPGAGRAGEVLVVGLGVPAPAVDRLGLLERTDLAHLLPPRPVDAHKGSAGHVLVVAGSTGKSGAAWLTARGAFRAGAGLVTLATRDPDAAGLMPSLPEAMLERLSDADAIARAMALASTRAASVVGPGLGIDEAGRELSLALAADLPHPVVLDADALTHLAAAGVTRLRDAAGPRVLTPHPGEAGRLLGVATAQVQGNRLASARELASRSGQVAVLKGAGSVVASPDGRTRICPFGTPAMGTAGSGDVLAGMLGALASGMPPFEAAVAAVLLHALAGERAAVADRGLLARELADSVPHVLAVRFEET